MGMTSGDVTALAVGLVVAGIALMIGFSAVQRRSREDPPPPRSIAPVAEVDELTVLLAAHVVSWRRRSVTAQLVALAQRGAIRIERDDRRWALVRGAEPVDELEGALLAAFFDAAPHAGERVELDLAGAPVLEVQHAVNVAVQTRGLRARRGTWRWVFSVPLAAGILLGLELARHSTVGWAAVVVLGVFLGLVAVGSVGRSAPLTARGAVLRDRMLGVRALLEAPPARPVTTAADRRALAPLLPLAVLFGLEQRWVVHGGAVDGELLTFVAEVGGRGTGSGATQRGDAWQHVSTGGSSAETDGADVPVLE
jgi:hypothetical protein